MPDDVNAQVIEQFRTRAGQVGMGFEGVPLLLLHTVGARTGTPRVNPLVQLPDGDRYVVIASAGGAPSHPAWYHNLMAHPDAVIEVVGPEGDVVTRSVRATEAHGEERRRLWDVQMAVNPAVAQHEGAAGRALPFVVLTPV
jgi:deazaflavin-dependent oxidoreductase (nitroreductase family)